MNKNAHTSVHLWNKDGSCCAPSSLMNNLLARLNATFYTFVSCMFGLAGVVALISMTFHIGMSESSIDGVELKRLEYIPKHRMDAVLFDFNLEADVAPLFHWNTKQVYLYILASWETKHHSRNDAVVWDKIIRRDDPKALVLSNERQSYYLLDLERKIKGKEVTLSLHWETFPFMGFISHGDASGGNFSLILPSKYL